MKNQITFETEWNKRIELIESAQFRKLIAAYAQSIGVTEKEWDENKAGILLLMANEFCGHENKLTKRA